MEINGRVWTGFGSAYENAEGRCENSVTVINLLVPYVEKLLSCFMKLTRPKLHYASATWNSSVTATEAKKLESIQRKF
jgi:hypothetical protein